MKKRINKIILLATLMISVVSLVACGSQVKKNTSQNNESIQTTSDTKAFPKFKAKDLEGNAVDETVFSKHPVTVVSFWFAGCKGCVDEMPALEKMNNNLQKKDVKFLGIDTDYTDSPKDLKKILKTNGVTYQNLQLTANPGKPMEIFSSNFSNFPITLLVNRKGEIVETIEGTINSPERMKEINLKIDKIIKAAL